MHQRGETIYINFYDEINPGKVKVFMAVCADVIDKFRPSALYICLSSPGGHVAAGITLHNFLKSLPVKIIMHNTGSVDSIATMIFLAGRERYATPSSTFLFHGVQTHTSQPVSLSIYQLREILSGLEQDHNKIVHIITNNTQLSEDEVRELFKQGESKSPAFAESKGIVHAVRDLSIPANAKLISLNFN